MNLLLSFAQLVRRLRSHSNFGDLSRAPLDLLRIEFSRGHVECDCIARPPDQWDSGLPRRWGERNASTQALRDAIAIRELLFQLLPDLRTTNLRIYRKNLAGSLELVVTGLLAREDTPHKNVQSLAMRAKLLGFRFWLTEGVLECLTTEKHAVNS